jgi:hypothetical protein
MKQEQIGITPIKNINERINKFMGTTTADYFEDENALQKAVEHVKSLGFSFYIDDIEASISGESLEPANITAIGDTTREATILALDTFARMKNNNDI